MAGFCRDGHNYAIMAAVFGGILGFFLKVQCYFSSTNVLQQSTFLIKPALRNIVRVHKILIPFVHSDPCY